MKRKWLILAITPIIFLTMSAKLLAPPYSVVCVDPGHGGPGAWKYGPNGDEHGTCGPVLHLSEQWVNLQVGLQLEFIIDVFGTPYDGAIMTRYEDIDTDGPHRANTNKKFVTFLKIIKFDVGQ